MKTALSFGLIVAAASTLFACSEDSGTTCRTNCGGTGNATSNAGSSGAPSGGNTNTGGTSGGNTNTGGGPNVFGGNTGPALRISATGAVTEPGLGISGQAFYTQSDIMAVPTTFTSREGEVCISGETAAVVMDNYDDAWGAELTIDLQRPGAGAGDGDAGAADAGDAGGGEGDGGIAINPTGAWPVGNTIGFVYTITGKDTDPASVSKGVPDLGLRFKGLPEGADGANDSYCSTRCGGVNCPTSGDEDPVLFSDITYECWNMGNPSLADAMIPVVDPTAPATDPAVLVPNPRALQNITWQVNADPLITKPFNFCVSNIRPILP